MFNQLPSSKHYQVQTIDMQNLRTVAGITALAGTIAGCAAPQMSELRATTPNSRAMVSAPVSCLYEKASERVSSYLGMSEPKFQGFINASGSEAWFRQPLTLVLIKEDGHSTIVTRHQTPSAEAFGQADDLMAYLSSNPCQTRRTPN